MKVTATKGCKEGINIDPDGKITDPLYQQYHLTIKEANKLIHSLKKAIKEVGHNQDRTKNILDRGVYSGQQVVIVCPLPINIVGNVTGCNFESQTVTIETEVPADMVTEGEDRNEH